MHIKTELLTENQIRKKIRDLTFNAFMMGLETLKRRITKKY